MQQYPKVLYGKKGCDDLSDYVIVSDEEEEKTARENGYAPLDEVRQSYNDETRTRANRSSRR